MRFRLEWIASYLSGADPIDARQLAERLTAAGLTAEGVEGEGAGAVLDLEITANRPDAMNHRGVAREAALAIGRAFVDPPAPAFAEGSTRAESLASVRIDEPSLCSRYSARVIEGIRVGPASAAVRERLTAIGASAISAPVDATNHVLWDIGQPMHAFDLDKLAKGPDGRAQIVVRRARAGETLVTLDGVTRTLAPDHLVIADAEKAVALAGVMGGLDTAIGPSTTRILLESAHFDPTVVRRTARALGMHTDASHRFERGTDPETTVEGLDRAARLIVADAGGTVAAGRIDVVARKSPRLELTLRSERRDAFLGMRIDKSHAFAILEGLGFEPRTDGLGHTAVTVPSWRVDVGIEVDLIEELIRCVGYDQLPETLPAGSVPAASDERSSLEDRVRDLLAGSGLVEAQTYSFVSPRENEPFRTLAPGDPVVLANPLGEAYSVMRATPLAGLLASAQHNVRRGARDLALFEVGRAFGRDGAEIRERRSVTFLLHGQEGGHWSETARPVDFFDGSGVVAALFAGLGATVPAFRAETSPFLTPGRTARVVAADGTPAGWVGVLAPGIATAYDLVEPVVADLDLAAIVPLPPPTSVEMPSRFPGSDVDVTVTHRIPVPFRALVDAVKRDAPAELLTVDARSRYQGAGVPEGFVKTSLNLRFGSPERSLSREEVNSWRDDAARRLLALGETRIDGLEGL